MKSRKPKFAQLAPKTSVLIPVKGYRAFLEDLKSCIRQARIRASFAANQELLLLYYSIGLDLHQRSENEVWGTAIIERLANDLHKAFPDMQGFSPRNLRRMRAFYRAYSLDPKSLTIWPQAVAKIELIKWSPAVAKLTWAHNVILLEKCKNPEEREWYASAALEYGWGRDVLALHIDTGLIKRQGKAVSNFGRTLPLPHSDLAQQITRDPYQFEFLSLESRIKERELEKKLIEHLKDFLVALGKGFAFVGSQVPLSVGDADYYLDLLFYHVHLHCYVVIELKEGSFKPEYLGKMNFYLSAVDDLMRRPEDRPTIGLLLCKSKDKFQVEYALRDINKPIGVADWETRIVKSLPKELKGSLPTIEEIEKELEPSL